MPFEPEVFGKHSRPKLPEEVAQAERDAAALDDGRRRARVEIEGEDGRHLDRSTPWTARGAARARRAARARPASACCRPGRSRSVAGPVGEHGRRLHPLGPVLGAALLEEVEALDAVGVALERGRAALQVRDHGVGDPGVVVDHLALGEPGLRVEDLVEVGQLQLAPADRYDFATSSQPWPLPSLGLGLALRARRGLLRSGLLGRAFGSAPSSCAAGPVRLAGGLAVARRARPRGSPRARPSGPAPWSGSGSSLGVLTISLPDAFCSSSSSSSSRYSSRYLSGSKSVERDSISCLAISSSRFSGFSGFSSNSSSRRSLGSDDLVGEAHRRHGQHVAHRADRGQVLLVAEHEAGDRDLARSFIASTSSA